MNNFFETYCNAVNCTSCVAIVSRVTNTPPYKYSDNQVVNNISQIILGITAFRKR